MAGAYSSAYSSAYDVGGGGGSSIVLLLTLLEAAMESREILKGSTDQSVVIRIVDSTTGLPEEAVEHDTAGISLWYRREGGSVVAITPAALAAANSAHSDGGIEHLDDGDYRLDLPDAAVASGANGVKIGGTITGMVVIGPYIALVDYNPYDGVRLGLTALPNAAADAAGGLPISDAGGLDLDAKLANTNEVTAARMAALTDWIDGGRLDLIVDAILADTNELQGDWVNGGRLDLILDATATATALASLVTTVGAAGAGLTEAGGTGDHLTALATAAALATVDGIADDIKANTNYPDGYVYLSSFFGAAGTTLGTNGTWRNPVSTIADALTLANSIGGIKFMPNSAVTASSGTLADRVIDIHGGALTVASSVSLGGTLIYSTGRRGNLYGTALAQVTTSNTFLENLYVSGVIATAATLEMRHCGLSGNVTDSTGGPNASFRPLLIDCYNFKGDGSAVTFALAGGGHWHLLGWYGDIEITGMAAGQVFYANGWGKLTIAASCTGGTIKHTSHIEIDDQASGAVTTELISEPTPWNAAWDAEVQSECTDALNAYDPPTNAEMVARTLVAADYFDPTADAVANVTTVGTVTNPVAITSNVKKNQALAEFQFLMTDATTHEPATGLTVTCTRSIDGAAFGAGTLANVTEVANGSYTVDFGAGDLNGNVIILKATATGADTTFERIITQP